MRFKIRLIILRCIYVNSIHDLRKLADRVEAAKENLDSFAFIVDKQEKLIHVWILFLYIENSNFILFFL